MNTMSSAGARTHALNATQIFDEAARDSGLAAFADEGIRARFQDLVAQMNGFGLLRDAELPPAVAQLRDLVTKRLQIARDWQEHPEILDEQITQPFFVIGNARAGTTFAQSILVLGEGHRTPRYRNCEQPSPPTGLDPAADARGLEKANEFVRYMVEKSPRMMQAHPYLEQAGNSESEDEHVYSQDFHIAYPLNMLKIANLPQTILPKNPQAAMQFHKNMLKHYQWKSPVRRWVGKGVLHQYLMGDLLQAYPDAVCFWMHRAPEEYIASLLELLELQYKPFNGDLYNVQPGAMVEQLRAGADYFMSLPTINDPRVHHIRFREFVADPAAVLGPIFEKSGIPYSKTFEDRIRQRSSDPAYRADRFGKFEYSLDKFGLKQADLRRTFADYCDRFGL